MSPILLLFNWYRHIFLTVLCLILSTCNQVNSCFFNCVTAPGGVWSLTLTIFSAALSTALVSAPNSCCSPF